MTYLVFTLFSSLWLSILYRYKIATYKEIILFSVPVIILWVIIIGGQYYIGTDYPSYISIFNGVDIDSFKGDGEIAFTFFVKYLNGIGIRGQDIMFVIAFFWIVILIYFANNIISSKYIFLFFFVFITFSTAFNNQMNGMRQYISVYLFSCSLLFLNKRKYLHTIVLFVLTRWFHTSALLLIPLYLLLYNLVRCDNIKYLYYSIFIALIVNLSLQQIWIEKIMSTIGLYTSYIGSDYFREISIVNKLSKFIYLPIVLYSIKMYYRYKINNQQRRLFKLSIYCYAIMIACMSFSLTYRLSSYFTIISCIPITYLLKYLYDIHKVREQIQFITISLFLLVVYGIKVTVLAKGEYLFDSIFLH